MKATNSIVLTFVFLFLLVQVCAADSFANIVDAKNYVDKIMTKVATGDIEGGLKMMKPYIIIPPAEFDAMIGKVELQLPAITMRFGKSIGKEFISEDKIGGSFERILYLHKFEKSAMRWRFYLYKGSDGWNINTFKFDDSLPAMFPE